MVRDNIKDLTGELKLGIQNKLEQNQLKQA